MKRDPAGSHGDPRYLGFAASAQVFTTGQAAHLCGLSQQTIIRCFDRGELGGFRIPGSRSRRIPRADILRFVRDHDLPVQKLLQPKLRVVLLSLDRSKIDLLVDQPMAQRVYHGKAAACVFGAGLLTAQFRPNALVLDASLPGTDIRHLCQTIRRTPIPQPNAIVVLIDGPHVALGPALRTDGADAVLEHTVGCHRLLSWLEHHMGLSVIDEPNSPRIASP